MFLLLPILVYLTPKKFLLDWHWPGNVRELRNVVQRAYIMADDSINAAFFPQETGKSRTDSGGPFLQIRVGSTVAQVERVLTLATLQQCGGVKEKAAQMLGVSLKTLYNRLREYESPREPASPDRVPEPD